MLAGWGSGKVLRAPVEARPEAIFAMARLAEGCAWLAVPFAHQEVGALQLVELDAALRAWGLPELVVPLLRCGWRELGRLGLAYEVDFAATVDCGCGACETCAGKARALVAAGFGRVARG